VEESEVSEEELQGIPGVTESDEDEQGNCWLTLTVW
jgi:hypothetical protein